MDFMDYVEEEKDEARKEGIENTKISNAKKMLEMEKYSYDEIVEITGLTLEKVKEIAQQ